MGNNYHLELHAPEERMKYAQRGEEDPYANDPRYLIPLTSKISLFFTLVSVYFILKKSSQTIQVYKWYLLNITISCALFENFVREIYKHDFLHPEIQVTKDDYDIQLTTSAYFSLFRHILFVALIFNMNFSLLASFFYRMTATMGISKRFHTLKYLLICVSLYLLFLLPVISSFTYAFFMAKEHIESELQRSPENILNYCFNWICIFIVPEKTPKAAATLIATLLINITLTPLLCLVISVIIVYKLLNHGTKLSQQTYKMQRNMFISLIVQFILPFLFISIPIFILFLWLAFGNLKDKWPYKIGHFLLHACSMHMTLNTLAMIFTIKPYRDVVLNGLEKVFCCWKRLINRNNHGNNHPNNTPIPSISNNMMFQRRVDIVGK